MGILQKLGLRQDAPSKRADGWKNALTGVGTLTHDKREHSHFELDLISYEEARKLYRGDDLAARIVNKLPEEMMREGYSLTIENSEGEPNKDLENAVLAQWEDLEVMGGIETVLGYQRAYGGGAIYLSVSDTSSLFDEPLSPERVIDLVQLITLEPEEIFPHTWQNDLREPNFGKPIIYQITPLSPGVGEGAPFGSAFVHTTRVIPFDGIRVSRSQASITNGWGDSIFNRINRVLRDFHMSWDAAGVLVQEFAQAVVKIKGLAELMALDKDDIVKKRIEAMQLSKSVLRAILMDAEEEYERQTTPITGLPDMLRQFMTRLAVAADMPVTVLFGISPAGLNATGESDIRTWYDRVKSKQEKTVVPVLMQITKLILATMGISDAVIKIEPNELWQQTEKEKAEARKLQAETDNLYINNFVLGPDEVAENRFGGKEFSFETSLDFDNRVNPEPPPPVEPKVNAPKAA